MLKIENILINGKEFVRTTSTENKYIKQLQTGAMYAEAIDLVYAPFTYEETDVEIERDISKIESSIFTETH